MLFSKIAAVHPNKQLTFAVSLSKEHKKEYFVSEIEKLELSKSQEDYNLSIILDFAIKDTDRIMKAFKQGTKSASETALKCCAILSDDQLKDLIFNSVPNTRRKLVKKIRKNHPKLMEEILPEYSRIFKTDALSIVPFVKNEDENLKTLKRLDITEPSQLSHLNVLNRRTPKVMSKLLEASWEKNTNKTNATLVSITNFFLPLPRPLLVEFMSTKVNTSEMFPSPGFLGYFGKYPKIVMEWIRLPHVLKGLDIGLLDYNELSVQNLCDILLLFTESFPRKATQILAYTKGESQKKWLELVKLASAKVDFIALYKSLDFDGELPIEFSHSIMKTKLEEKLKVHKMLDRDKAPFYTYMAIDEVRKPIYELATNSDAIIRSTAYEALIKCTFINGNDCWKETLSWLSTKTKKEQDPNKSIILQTIIDHVPTNRYVLDDIDTLDTWLEPWFVAQDRSAGTLENICSIGILAICYHSDSVKHSTIALKWFTKFLNEYKRLPSRHVPGKSSYSSTSIHLYEWTLKNFSSYAIEEMKKRTHQVYQQLADTVPTGVYPTWRSDLFDSLQEMSIRDLLTREEEYTDVRSAVVSWIKRPETRDQRVKVVLALDNSAITIDCVQEHLLKVDHDTLREYIKDKKLITTKSFKTKKSRFLDTTANFYFDPIRVNSSAHILPKDIRESLVAIYDLALIDPEVRAFDKVNIMLTSAHLQIGALSETFTRMLAYCKQQEDEKLSQVAISCCARVDYVDLTELFEMINKDNARGVVGAIRGLIRYTPDISKQWVDIINGPKFFKNSMSIQKELIRLAPLFPNDIVFDALHKHWKHPKTQKDILICIAHVTLLMLPLESAWNILNEIPSTEILEIAQVVFTSNSTWSVEIRSKIVDLQYKLLDSKVETIIKEAWGRILAVDDAYAIKIAEFAEGKIYTFLEDNHVWELKIPIVNAFCKAIGAKLKLGLPILKRLFVNLTKMKDVDVKLSGKRGKDLAVSRLISMIGYSFTERRIQATDEERAVLFEISDILITYDEMMIDLGLSFVKSSINGGDMSVKSCVDSLEKLTKEVVKVGNIYKDIDIYGLIDEHVIYFNNTSSNVQFRKEYFATHLKTTDKYIQYSILGMVVPQFDFTDEIIEFVVKCRTHEEGPIRRAAKDLVIVESTGTNSDSIFSMNRSFGRGRGRGLGVSRRARRGGRR